jgi:hypothetical protein
MGMSGLCVMGGLRAAGEPYVVDEPWAAVWLQAACGPWAAGLLCAVGEPRALGGLYVWSDP